MLIDFILSRSLSLKAVTQDVKWENHLCLNIGEKMFLVLAIEEVPVTASVKVSEEAFDQLCQKDGIGPAPYLARYKWVKVYDINSLSQSQWGQLIEEAYELTKNKLPKKFQKELGLS